MKRKKPAMIMFATATEISPAFAAGSHLEQLLMGKLAECLTPAITEALEAHRIYGSTLIRTYMDNGNPVIAMVPVEQWITGLD